MRVITWISFLAILHAGFCQEIDGGYLNILLDGFTNAGTTNGGGISTENLLAYIGQDNILRYITNILTSSLEDAARNDTSSICLNHTELFIEALLRRENWAFRSMYIYIFLYFSHYFIKAVINYNTLRKI